MNRDSVQVRKIELGDESHRRALLALLDHYARDPMGGGSPLTEQAQRLLIPGLRTRSDYVGFLAFVERDAVGLINCFEGFSTFAAKPLLNIHDLVVHESARGRGVGQRLLAAAEAEAVQRGCCKLTLEVLSKNSAALSSYTRAGFAGYQLDPNAGHALFLEKKLVS